MDARYIDLYAAVARQAFQDVDHDYHGRGMDARQWLELAGVVDADGTSRSRAPRRQRSSSTTEHYNARRRVVRADEERRELQVV